MSNCNNRVKQTCGSTNYATCISYETELPTFSELEDCVDLDQTTTELYSLVGGIKEEIDLSELGKNCLDYLTDENDKIVVKNVLLKFEEKICELEEKINTLETTAVCDLSISSCNIDWGTLADQCGEQPQTLAQAIQLLANQHNT
jgi:hypothetical protein